LISEAMWGGGVSILGVTWDGWESERSPSKNVFKKKTPKKEVN